MNQATLLAGAADNPGAPGPVLGGELLEPVVLRTIIPLMVSQVPQRMDRTLSGGQVQRLAFGRVGARHVTLLQVRVPGETVYVLVASGCGVGLIDGAARKRLRAGMLASAPAEQARWRSHLEGARVTYVGESVIALVREGAAFRAVCEQGTLALNPASGADPEQALAWDTLQERGALIAEELLRANVRGRRDALGRALSKAIGRIGRRIEAVGRDVSKMDLAEQDARRARLFVAQAASALPGTTTLRAVDWSSAAPETVEWQLNPAKSAQEQLTATFKRARRMKDGAVIASSRLRDASEARDVLCALVAALQDPQADLGALEARARARAPRDFKLASASGPTPGRRRQDTRATPYRKFNSASGLAILVGRGALQNDVLTTRVAKPHDLWLHAKGRTGAHVVVPLEKGASCPPDLLVEAAHLAAHFSEARDESVVEVLYTPRRYVRKPRASAPGAVTVDREKVIVLRKSDDILRKLLEREAENASAD